MTTSIGQKIKKLRQERDLTLKELSEKSNLSTGFLSKLERGMTSISVESLAVIAQCLETNVQYFFSEERKEKRGGKLLRRYEKELMHSESHQRINYLLATDIGDKEFLPKLVELLPGFNEELQHSYHVGQEFIYVMEGTLSLILGGEHLELYPGDSIFFDSSEEHTWVNYTNKITKLMVITHPNVYKIDDKS